jgi:hypothetical protein
LHNLAPDALDRYLTFQLLYMEKKTKIRPPMGRAWGWSMSLLLAILLLSGVTAAAQSPQFRKWNLGAVLGSSPVNGGTLLPSLRGYYGRMSLEVAPYPFCMGAGVTYHHPVSLFKQRMRLSLDATAYAARRNSHYFVIFPGVKFISNRSDVGVLVGPSFYFLKRMCLQTMLGVAYVAPYGEQPFNSFPRNPYVGEQAAISLEIQLFNSFQQ